MFSFGLGVGLPFLAIGLFGVSLPKSGRWMLKTQVAIGLLILYFAFVYLQKGLGVLVSRQLPSNGLASPCRSFLSAVMASRIKRWTNTCVRSGALGLRVRHCGQYASSGNGIHGSDCCGDRDVALD